jgi:Mg2+ and Co2+ transporter CorA
VLAGMLAAIFGCAAFVAGVFGMNFKTPLFDAEAEEFGYTEGTLFNIVTITLLILLLTAGLGTYCFFSTAKCFSLGFLRRGGKSRRDEYFEA